MTDVTNALNAGHEVTISQSQINFKGWTGSGYIIIDPNNGSGAYLISGGANGSIILATLGALLLLVALTALTGGLGPIVLGGALASATGGGAFFIGITSLVSGLTLYLVTLGKLYFKENVEPNCTALALTTGAISWALFRFGKKPDSKKARFFEDLINIIGFAFSGYTLGNPDAGGC